MKKISILVSFLFIINLTLINAQTEKGKILVGVSSTFGLAGSGSDLMTLGYSTTKFKSNAKGFKESDPDKILSLNLLPKVGYFVIDNLAVGLDISLALSNHKEGSDNDSYSNNMMSAGPFFRYYIPTGKVIPYFEATSSFGRIKTKLESDDYDDEEYKTNVTSFGAGLGVAVPLGNKVTFDLLAGYTSLTMKDKEDNTDNERTVYGTVGLKFGFTILLGSK